MYEIYLTKRAEKDAVLISRAGLKVKVIELINIIRDNPFANPPPYEILKGDLQGAYSRRINRQHRLVYEVLPSVDVVKNSNGNSYTGVVKIIRMWSHYE